MRGGFVGDGFGGGVFVGGGCVGGGVGGGGVGGGGGMVELVELVELVDLEEAAIRNLVWMFPKSRLAHKKRRNNLLQGK